MTQLHSGHLKGSYKAFYNLWDVPMRSPLGWSLLLLALSILLYALSDLIMILTPYFSLLLGFSATQAFRKNGSTDSSEAAWFPPNRTQINDLSSAINGTGVYGFIFNNSYTETGNSYYGGYNWCNMPHVNKRTYPRPSSGFALQYVEVVSLSQPYWVKIDSIDCRSIDTISEPHTQPTLSLEKTTLGTVKMKAFSTTASL